MTNPKEIYKMAKSIGLGADCKAEMIQDHSLKKLGEMYFKGSDWSMEHDFPNLKLLRELKGQTEQYGLYTDHSGQIHALQRMALFGNSNAIVNYNGFSVSEIIIRHDTKVKIVAKDYSYLVVNVLDSAHVEIESKDNATVSVYVYGNSAKITGSTNVIIRKSTFE